MMKILLLMKMNFVLVFLIIQNKERIWKIIMWLLLVKMHVKVILVVLLFVQLTIRQFWLELFRMEVDVAKQENQEFMEKSISSKNGFEQVTYVVKNRRFNQWFYWPPFLIKTETIFTDQNQFFWDPGFYFWMENTIVQFWEPGSGTRVPRFFWK